MKKGLLFLGVLFIGGVTEACRGVDFPSKNQRHVAGKNVPDKASGYTRRHAHDDRDTVHMGGVKRLLEPDDGEDGQTECIGIHQDRHRQFPNPRQDERADCRNRGHCEIVGV